MNKLLILQVILNELNHISGDNEFCLGMESDPLRSVIILENEKEEVSDVVCYFDQIDSFAVCDDCLSIYLKDNSIFKLNKNGMEWD